MTDFDEMTTDELYDELRDAIAATDRARTSGWLTGKQLDEEMLMATDGSDETISLRISPDLLERIEDAREEFDAPITSPSGEVSRSEAMRRLMVLGIERLDEQDDTDG